MSDTLLKLEEFLPYRLSILSNKVSSSIAQTYRDKFAISVTEWRIMAVLGEYPGSSADEVSAKTQIEKSILSRSISKLLKRNMLNRQMSKQDKRRSELTLSALGQSIYAEIVPVSLQYQKTLLSCFSDEEYALFSDLINKLDRHSGKV